MLILSLNVWGGIVGQPLLDFFSAHQEIDVFLLQEMFSNATEKTVWDDRQRPNVFSEIGERLPDHTGYFAPSVVYEWGLAAFARKTLPLRDVGDVFVHKSMDSLVERDGSSIGRNVQYLILERPGMNALTIANFHGIWAGHGVGKGDTPERIAQSERVVAALKARTGELVLGGDFNLNPDTRSLELIEQGLGLRNLIREYDIRSTRTSLYTKPGTYADYMFVSPGVQVRSFCVLPDVVSDHAPLLLEVEKNQN